MDFSKNASKDFVPAKDVLLGFWWQWLMFRPSNFQETSIIGTDFDWTYFFTTENHFNMGVLTY